MGFENLFGALAKEALNLVRERTGVDLTGSSPTSPAPNEMAVTDAPPPSGGVPFQLDRRPMPAGESVDALLPPVVGPFARKRVNNNFGGPRSGGIFAAYVVDGVEVRVLASLAAGAAAAREQIASRTDDKTAGVPSASAESLGTEPSFSAAPGAFTWNRGPYVFSVGSHGTDGDIALPATEAQIAALDRFLDAFPY